MSLLGFAKIVNDLDGRLPKGRSDCFDIGSWGGCCIDCEVFQNGECENPFEGFENWKTTDYEIMSFYCDGYYVEEIYDYFLNKKGYIDTYDYEGSIYLEIANRTKSKRIRDKNIKKWLRSNSPYNEKYLKYIKKKLLKMNLLP